MQENIHLSAIIPIQLAGMRLDACLVTLFPQYSRARFQEWIKAEQVLVNDKSLKQKDKISGGEHVHVIARLEDQTSWQAQAIPMQIIHEDADLLIINKPIGLVTHPAAGNPDNTLLNALLHHEPSLAKLPRAGIVHRLDKDTSGIMMVAKTLDAHTFLVKALQARTVSREYLAIVRGQLTAGGTLEAPIGRHPQQRTKMAVVTSGKHAITHYRVLERFPGYTYIRVKLETGRTHQIRVHMAHIKHPIIGDPCYGGRLHIPKGTNDSVRTLIQAYKHQALHAERLSLTHPRSGETVSYTAPIPDDMNTLLTQLREDTEHA